MHIYMINYFFIIICFTIHKIFSKIVKIKGFDPNHVVIQCKRGNFTTTWLYLQLGEIHPFWPSYQAQGLIERTPLIFCLHLPIMPRIQQNMVLRTVKISRASCFFKPIAMAVLD